MPSGGINAHPYHFIALCSGRRDHGLKRILTPKVLDRNETSVGLEDQRVR